AAGLTVQQIVGVLQANNLTLPSGQLPTEGTKVPVSTSGECDSVEDIEGLVVGYKQPAAPVPPASAAPGASGQPSVAPSAPAAPAAPTPITLSELGKVELVELPTTGYARTNGQPSLTLTVTKTSDANTVDVAASVEAAL